MPSAPVRCRATTATRSTACSIAQGQLEDVPIVTGDPLIGTYDVETIW